MAFTACSAPEAHVHNYGEWKTVKETSCAEAGLKKRTCSECGHAESQEIAALPHTEEIKKEGFEPTCVNPGQEPETVCTVCGATVKNRKNIPALGHDFKITTVVQPDLSTKALENHKCKRCGFETKQTGNALSPENVGMPIMYITGDIENISKWREKSVTISFSGDTDFECYAVMKVQGNSSQAYEKKNFSIKLYEDEAHTDKNKLDLGWGKEFKYCLKANYVDYSQLRNIVSCRLFADVTATRKKLDPNIKSLPTYATVDGYPILLYVNGSFHGLYTLNIPKDKWMYGMKDDESKRQAVLCSERASDYNHLKKPMDSKLTDWEIEHCSTADTAWVRTSFNNFINFLNNNDGEAFKKGIDKYLDVDAAIDTMLFTILINGLDNTAKNINYVTYDGVKWIPVVYDLDATWGLWWDGTKLMDQGMLMPTFKNGKYDGNWRYNVLWDKLFENYPEEIKARYNQLRGSVFTYEHIMGEFEKLEKEIPDIARISEKKRWYAPSCDMEYMLQIGGYAYNQLLMMDEAINKL
jgi:hypothetical protein